MSAPRIVIVGGGFGGISALEELRRQDYDITLIDRHPYSTFQPLLYQVATGGLNPGDITYPLRRLVSRRGGGSAQFRQGTVTGIDADAHVVTLDNGTTVGYDKLILAQGVGANYFGIPGAEENSQLIYTRGEALRARDLVVSGLEAAANDRDPDSRFTVVIVGGGATGVEMAGALAEMKSEALPVLYPELSVDNFHVVLIEMAPALLTPFAPRLRAYALKELRKRGVDVRLNTSVEKVDRDHLMLSGGRRLDASVVIWASGVAARPAIKQWALPQGKGGRILVDKHLKVQGHHDIYAVGDAALIESDPLPQLASPAIQMGTYVAREIAAEQRDESVPDFTYNDRGTMATIGRNAAVVQLHNGPRLTGFPAWAIWVGLHLAELLGGRNRLQTMINMAMRYFSWPNSAATIVGDVTPPQRREPKG